MSKTSSIPTPRSVLATSAAAGAAIAVVLVTGGVNPRMDGEACAGEEKGAAEAPGLFNGMAVQSDGLSVVWSV